MLRGAVVCPVWHTFNGRQAWANGRVSACRAAKRSWDDRLRPRWLDRSARLVAECEPLNLPTYHTGRVNCPNPSAIPIHGVLSGYRGDPLHPLLHFPCKFDYVHSTEHCALIFRFDLIVFPREYFVRKTSSFSVAASFKSLV